MALGFYRFDLGKDGLVGEDDFTSLGQQVAEQLECAQGSAPATQIVQAFINLWQAYGKAADRNGDNTISFDDFEARAAFLQTPAAREKAVGMNIALFAAIDTDGDGRLSMQEYAAFLKPIGISTAEAETAFQHLDRDGDGFISDDELAVDLWEYWHSDDRSAPGNWFFGAY